MKLLGNRVLVKRVDPIKAKSAIILPGTFDSPVFQGEVIQVGPGFQSNDGTVHPIDVKPGDTIIFTSVSGFHLKLNGETYTLLKATDMLLILEDDEIVEQTNPV